MEKKAVILLGAGFAMTYGGPSSEDLRVLMKKMAKDNALLKRVLDVLDNYYGENNYSFETIVAVVESLWIYYDSKQIPSGKTADNCSFMPAVYSTSNEWLCRKIADDNKLYCEFRHLYYDLIKAILSKISYDNCDKVDFNDEKYDSLKTFVEKLKGKGYAIKFYTLNYDRLIPCIFESEVYEGLEEPVPHEEPFNFGKYDGMNYSDIPASQRESDKAASKQIGFKYDLKGFCFHPFTHFNLHGSKYLCGHKIDKHLLVFQQNNLGYHNNGNPEGEGGNLGEPLFTSPIIVGQSKTQRVFSLPFRFGFDAFSYDCATSDVFFSFGYAFRDPHINSILRTYIVLRNIPTDVVVKGNDTSFTLNHDYPWCTRISELPLCDGKEIQKRDQLLKENICLKGLDVYLSRECYCEII